MGDYERLRFQDEQSIAKLKDRLTQLDLEHTALAQAAQQQPHAGHGKCTVLYECSVALLQFHCEHMSASFMCRCTCQT